MDDYEMVDECVKAAKIQLLRNLQYECHQSISSILGSITERLEKLEGLDNE